MDQLKELEQKVEFYDFVSEDFMAPDCPFSYSIPEIRQEIDDLLIIITPDSKSLMRLNRADRDIIAFIDNLPDDYDEDDPNQPFERWWWHLKAIKEDRFPRKFLPRSQGKA